MAKEQVKIDDQEVRIMLNDFDKFFSPLHTKRLLTEIASLGKIRILERTAKGKDVDNNFFKSYSPATVHFRQKRGRPTDKVDLFFSGRMLGSLAIKSNSKKASLYFPPTESKKAIRHQEGIGLPIRKFFGLNAKDVKEMDELIDDEINEVLRGS